MTSPPLRISDIDFIGKTVDDGRLRLVEMLGEGAYGVVYRAVDDTSAASSSRPEPKEYAVKIMEKVEAHSRRWRYQQREVATHLSVTDHPHIVSILGLYECESFLYIVLEYCKGGDLLDALVDRLLYAGKDELLRSVFLQILDAVEYCHESGIYHRDLKPDNILTNEDGTQIKLADFGLATTAKVVDNFGCGSAYYMAPECIGYDYDYQPYNAEASDIWSLGIILTNLSAGRNPWKLAVMSDQSYLTFLTEADYLRAVLPISEEVADILQAIFDPDPLTRITLRELRSRIVAVKTFFMSAEEISRGTKLIQMVAATYTPPKSGSKAVEQRQPQSDVSDDEARNVPVPQSIFSSESAPTSALSRSAESRWEMTRNFVIVSSNGLSSSGSASSSADSIGPITPPTRAQDPAKLVEVPELMESERIGQAAILPVRKGHSLPASIARTHMRMPLR